MESITQVSTLQQKIEVYKQFFDSPTIDWLIVIGKGGTGKTYALKEARYYIKSRLTVVYPDEKPQRFLDPCDCERIRNDKYILHLHTFDESEWEGIPTDMCWVVEFV